MYGSGCKTLEERRVMQGNARGTWKWVQSARGVQGNARECQGNVWEWVQSAKEMQGDAGNATATYGSGCKVPGECREI